MVAYDPQGV